VRLLPGQAVLVEAVGGPAGVTARWAARGAAGGGAARVPGDRRLVGLVPEIGEIRSGEKYPRVRRPAVPWQSYLALRAQAQEAAAACRRALLDVRAAPPVTFVPDRAKLTGELAPRISRPGMRADPVPPRSGYLPMASSRAAMAARTHGEQRPPRRSGRRRGTAAAAAGPAITSYAYPGEGPRWDAS